MSQKVQKNVRRLYTQQVLSGFKHLIQPADQDGDSPQNEQRGAEKLPQEFWKQKNYQISISVIIEDVSTDSNEHQYKISINDDADILISPVSRVRQKTPKQVVTIHQETNSQTRKVPMVYGIHEGGISSLSYPIGYSIGRGITEFYSFLLGQIDRAIERVVLEQKNETGNDDTGKREKSPQSPKDLGDDTETRRSSKVRNKIRNENKPKNRSSVDEANGKILGRRPPNTGDRLDKVGDDPFIGTGLEKLSVDF